MPNVFEKLNLTDQKNIVVLDSPDSFESELNRLAGVRVHRSFRDVKDPSFVLAFVTRQQQLDKLARTVAARTNGDLIVWVAYPKGTSKRYRSDFNRDSGWGSFAAAGFEGVRMIAIDEDWSSLRLRRVEYIKTMTRARQRPRSA